jgi:adenylate kinase family enzyme
VALVAFLPMRRVLVIGSGGSGKTTLARRLAHRTGIPVIHLDSHYWRPGWESTPPDQWKAKVQELLARDAWIMDGNYGGTLESRLLACDTVVFLDLPRLLCLWRVLGRRLRALGGIRPELPAGCPERLSWEFLAWIWTYPARRRGAILRRLAELGREKRVIILRSRAEVEAFLAGAMPDTA